MNSMATQEAEKPIALYVRVSTTAQKYASQEAPLLEYVKSRKWPLSSFEIFREKASGVAKSRPVLDRIMVGARQGRVKTLVVFKLARLGRSLSHLSWVVDELKRMGVSLISLSEGIDTSEQNPMRDLQTNILGSFGQLERDMIRERTRSGYEAARKRGVKVGRPRMRDAFKVPAIELKKKGHSLEEIGRRLKISIATAYRLTRDCGAPKKVRGADRKPRHRKKTFSKSSPQNLNLFPQGV